MGKIVPTSHAVKKNSPGISSTLRQTYETASTSCTPIRSLKDGEVLKDDQLGQSSMASSILMLYGIWEGYVNVNGMLMDANGIR